MADNKTFATDEIGGVDYPYVKLGLGANGTALDWVGTTERGGYVDPRASIVYKTATPTITAGAYSAGDALGGLLTFATANRSSGLAITILSAQILDLHKQSAATDLVLFDRTFTATADNDPFDVGDADLPNWRGAIEFVAGDYFAFNDSSAASWPQTTANSGFPILLNGTSLFGQLVTRGTPTYNTTSDITVGLTILQH